jgi:S-adenosylmethionine hydrolase
MISPIVVLTDFGIKDPFVGIMKGVISSIKSSIPIIDLTHEIPPGDIKLGAVTLWQSHTYFPPGTIFLTVIDPGVGTHRRPLVIKSKGYTFIGPDNGIFSYVLDENFRAWELQNPKLALINPSTTFHGRDVFAPAAAYAASGIPGGNFGSAVSDINRIPYPKLLNSSSGVVNGEIIHLDSFGNALTSIGELSQTNRSKYEFHPWVIDENRQWADHNRVIDLKSSYLEVSDNRKLTWQPTFGEIPQDKIAFIVGSSRLIEIAANRQSAAKKLKMNPGDPVTLVL